MNKPQSIEQRVAALEQALTPPEEKKLILVEHKVGSDLKFVWRAYRNSKNELVPVGDGCEVYYKGELKHL